MDERLRRELWETDAIAAFELRWQVHLDQGRLDRLHALAAGGRSIEVTVSSLQPYTFMVSWVDILGSPLTSSDSYAYPPHSEVVRELFDQVCQRLEQNF